MKISYLLVFLYPLSLFANWEPPNNPDPINILNSLSDDRKNGRYQDALLKHIWLDDNASLYEDSFYGNRFVAMIMWHKLSQVYPPAKTLLEKKISTTRTKIINDDPCCPDAFSNYLAYNISGRNEIDVAELFDILDKQHPNLARKHFLGAKKSLFRVKRYDLIIKYIDSELEIDTLRNHFEPYKEHSSDYSNDLVLQELAVKFFRHRAATLVGLLSTNGRTLEAKRVYNEVLKVYDNQDFRIELKQALEGVIPQPLR